MITITKEEARKFLLRHQGLYNPRQLKTDKDIESFVQKVGCIQYDPLSKIARNADLVLQSRCKNFTEDVLYRLLYEKRILIDGWDKNMSIWALSDWPYFESKRIHARAALNSRSHELNAIREYVLKMLNQRDFISSKDIEETEKVRWSWGPTNIGRATLESMYHCGELIIHHKEGSRKYYGLTERFLPKAMLRKSNPIGTIEKYYEWYLKRRIGSIGLIWNKSGDAWLGTGLKAEHRSSAIKQLLEKEEIAEVKIDGIKEMFYIRQSESFLLAETKDCAHASTIAPLDNLIWDRKLISKIFNFDYKWEVYTPDRDRKYGYYVLPIVYGDCFVGRFEPVMDRKNNKLLIQNWWWEKGIKVDLRMKEAIVNCIKEFSKFLNAETVLISENLSRRKFSWIESDKT
jgi:uncharacterized protein